MESKKNKLVQNKGNKRLEREKKTVEAMIKIYCHRNHPTGTKGLCSQCKELKQYAIAKADNCVFGDNKPTCAKCSIHCYNKSMRAQIKQVMRYSGPRMFFRHPILTIIHLIHSKK